MLKQWGASFIPSSPDVPSGYDAENQGGENTSMNQLGDLKKQTRKKQKTNNTSIQFCLFEFPDGNMQTLR